MDFYGLDAMAHGATAALLVLLPAVFGFWRLTRGMAGGHRAMRPFVTACASYAAMLVAGGAWSILRERPGYGDEAMTGALIGGGAFALLAFLVLVLMPRST